MQPNIAIDGPAGAGKSTVARLVANQLGLVHIDTGAMYRALTWQALEQGISFEEPILADLARNIKISFTPGTKNTLQRIFCNGKDVTEEIRDLAISKKVSFLASQGQVRRELTRQQQRYADQGGVVMDGRDIGTCVLPKAEFKFFLTASLEIRSVRRYKELFQQGITIDLDHVRRDIQTRDQADLSREVGPLAVAKDARVIDTDYLTIEEVVQIIVSQYRGGK